MKTATPASQKFRIRPISRAVTLACGAAILSPVALAQDALEEIIVTAQKRDQSLQDVPISINVLSSERLTELGVRELEDYVQMLPNVSFIRSNPSRAEIYIRGISSGGNSELGGASNVAVYLDEQPITTASTYLNPHIYDIERIEVLAGPQGTLFGANAQSGAIRIITKKPDPSAFSAGYDLELNNVDHGDMGYLVEGYVNVPLLKDRAAIRLVGWLKEEAGYIDNVPTTYTFNNANIRAGLTDPALIAIAADITVDNSDSAKEDFNDSSTIGARAALRVDLNDNWTATAMVLRQQLETHGVWDHDPDGVGDLQVARLLPEREDDDYTQTSLTLQGQLGNVTLTYTGAYLDRHYVQDFDYSLYADTYVSGGFVQGYYSCYVSYFGACVDPRTNAQGDETTTRTNHEVRLASNPENRLRWLLGAFYENSDWISDLEFHVVGLSEFSTFDQNGLPVPGASGAIDPPDIYWTTDMDKFTDETAFFGQLEYDFTDQLTGSISARTFDYNAQLLGFSGTIWWPACCFQRPAANIDQKMNDNDSVVRANLSYSVTDDVMLFATYSEGYRPGGINRSFSGPIPPAYTADFLKSYEVGAKTTLLDGRLRFNGAIYFQNWDDFQLSRLDLSIAPITLTANVGSAESNGFEADFAFLASESWEFSGAFSFNKAELTKDYWVVQADEGVTPPDVAKGTELPRVPEVKFNLGARFNTEIMTRPSYLQAMYSYTGESWSQFSDTFKETRQQQASYDVVNLAFGLAGDGWDAELFVRNALDERGEVYRSNNSWDSRITTNRPRTIGLRWRQRF